jgi:hypothetical protein
MFWLLIKDDLKASIAILKLNMLGSTNPHLSWIWHNSSSQPGFLGEEFMANDATASSSADADASASVGADPGHIWECKHISCIFSYNELIYVSLVDTLASITGSDQ